MIGLLVSQQQPTATLRQSITKTGAPLHSSGPVTDYAAAQPSSPDVLRFRRGERYNSPDSPLPELSENSEPTLYTLGPTHFRRQLMPFEESDAVVIGTITAGQAYLSNDKRDIYSEFKASINEVIKTPNAPYLRNGDSIDVERPGGVIKMPSGKLITRAFMSESMPEMGKRYLLFLRYHTDAEDYRLLTGYQLEGSKVYYLDDRSWGESSRYQVLEHPLVGEGANEEEFLARVRAAFTKASFRTLPHTTTPRE